MHADLILKNCRIHTLWDKMPSAEVMAVGGSRILAVGPDTMDLAGPDTQILDLEGAAVVPGFIDAHNHFIEYGAAVLRSASLLGSRSISEIIQRLKIHRKKGVGQWVLGHCFDQELLDEKRFPTKDDLDEAFGDVPVLITRVCGHAVVVNSSVLEMIDGELPEEAKQTGILTEGRAGQAYRRIPSLTVPELKQAVLTASEEALSKGLTGVHCIISDADELQALRELHDEGNLPLRIYALIPPSMYKNIAKEGLSTGSGDEWLKIGAVKMFMDGSMGARTAALYDDFSDDPGNLGELFMTADELAAEVLQIQEKGFQAAVHAIGDRAVEETVDGFAKALAGKDNRILRHRVEHMSLTNPSIIEKMASLNLIASVQPQFVVSDFWTIDRVGAERYRYAYPFKTLKDHGISLAMGSDCPVEIIDPFQLIYRAATRDVYSRNESLSPIETLTAYCLGSAYASFEEDIKGSLEPGKLADFVVLSNDILNCDVEDIESTCVLSTYTGGKRIYST